MKGDIHGDIGITTLGMIKFLSFHWEDNQ